MSGLVSGVGDPACGIALNAIREKWTMKDKHRREMVTVCDACLTASCWYGEYMCQASQIAGTVDLPIETLRGLGREHEDYWYRDADGSPGKHSADIKAEDEGQVAIVLSEADINDLIWALRGNPGDAERLLPRMIQLRDEAFGEQA